MKVNHTESSYQMGVNDSTTKSSTAVTKRKSNTKQVPMLNSMFEIDISDNESDYNHTQETQYESADVKSPWRSKVRLSIFIT